VCQQKWVSGVWCHVDTYIGIKALEEANASIFQGRKVSHLGKETLIEARDNKDRVQERINGSNIKYNPVSLQRATLVGKKRLRVNQSEHIKGFYFFLISFCLPTSLPLPHFHSLLNICSTFHYITFYFISYTVSLLSHFIYILPLPLFLSTCLLLHRATGCHSRYTISTDLLLASIFLHLWLFSGPQEASHVTPLPLLCS
jgi:hypothetical protein